jgi:threonine dehydratase
MIDSFSNFQIFKFPNCKNEFIITTPTLNFAAAAERLQKIVNRTPLTYNHNLSRKYQCDVFLKREDLQVVRSYKLRGAYNMMSSLPADQLQKGVVCASAGNHAQGLLTVVKN